MIPSAEELAKLQTIAAALVRCLAIVFLIFAAIALLSWIGTGIADQDLFDISYYMADIITGLGLPILALVFWFNSKTIARLLLPAPKQIECPGCGYQTRGLTQPVCPECGIPLTAAFLAKQQPTTQSQDNPTSPPIAPPIAPDGLWIKPTQLIFTGIVRLVLLVLLLGLFTDLTLSVAMIISGLTGLGSPFGSPFGSSFGSNLLDALGWVPILIAESVSITCCAAAFFKAPALTKLMIPLSLTQHFNKQHNPAPMQHNQQPTGS